MGICAKELRHYVVRPTLKHLKMWSPTAENLLLGTAARESGLGFHLKQEHHQALGIFQISPRMHRNIWDHYLAKKSLSLIINEVRKKEESGNSKSGRPNLKLSRVSFLPENYSRT